MSTSKVLTTFSWVISIGTVLWISFLSYESSKKVYDLGNKGALPTLILMVFILTSSSMMK